MAKPTDDWMRKMLWENAPSLMVNCFRTEVPDMSVRYLYVPSSSFQLPVENAVKNVDYDPARFPKSGTDGVGLSGQIRVDTYVSQGPAFAVWPAKQGSLITPEGEIKLTEFRSVGPNDHFEYYGRRILPGEADRPGHPALPSFSAPVECPPLLADPPNLLDGRPSQFGVVSQVYEHEGRTELNFKKYKYDFQPEAHDEWGEGVPVFWAGRLESAFEIAKEAALMAQETRPTSASLDELTSPDSIEELSRLAKELFTDAAEPGSADATKPKFRAAESVATPDNALMSAAAAPTVDDFGLTNFAYFLQGRGLPVKVVTEGGSVDAAVIINVAGEGGTIWSLDHKALHDYFTIGAGLSPAVGATVNITRGFWWGESEADVLEKMKGLSKYAVCGGTLGTGVNFYFAMTHSNEVYGLTIAPQFGPEVELAVGFGATYTWLFEPSQ